MTLRLIQGLTLHQPWASLMAVPYDGPAKRNETRPWWTGYRGLLAIHAAANVPAYARAAWEKMDRAREVLAAHGWKTVDDLPKSCIVTVVRLVDCIATDTMLPEEQARLPQEGTDEWLFGDYRPRRFAWLTEDVVGLRGEVLRLKEPVACRGWQQLWRVPLEVEAKIWSQLSLDRLEADGRKRGEVFFFLRQQLFSKRGIG